MARHPTLLTPCLNADGPAPAASSSAPVLGAGQGISIAIVSPRYITLATPPIPETHSCSAIQRRCHSQLRAKRSRLGCQKVAKNPVFVFPSLHFPTFLYPF